MSNIEPNNTIANEYKSLLTYLSSDFHLIGQCNIPEVIIPAIATDDSPQYPFSESMITKLLSLSKPSAFGKGTKTMHDKNIRICKELDTTQFSIKPETFSFSSKSNKCLESIRESLMPHIEYIICQPYKLLIYEKDSFFKSHVDTPIQNQFGSLILSLPTQTRYEGGDFILNFNQTQIKWNFKDSQTPHLSEYIAFYSNIDHQIQPVTNGVRIVITFNLLIPSEFSENNYEKIYEKLFIEPSCSGLIPLKTRYYSPYVTQAFTAISNSEYCKHFHIPNAIIWIIMEYNGEHSAIESIRKLLNLEDWFRNKNTTFENAVCLILSHKYHSEYINPLHLKGNDMQLYDLCKQYFGVYVTPVTFKVSIGTWSDEYELDEEAESNDYEGRIIAEWNPDVSNASIRIGQNAFWSHKLPTVLNQRIDPRNGSFRSKFVVLYNNERSAFENGEKENVYDTCYGNCGAYDVHNLYYCTGLLLMRYERKLLDVKRKIDLEEEVPAKKQKTDK